MSERATVKQVSAEFQRQLAASEEMQPAHIRLFARLLSSNAELVDPEYIRDEQSHWNNVPREVINETKIAFFVPCLRLRWRCVEPCHVSCI